MKSVLVAVMVLAINAFAQQSTTTNTLEGLQATFEKAKASIDATNELKKAAALDAYSNVLAATMQTLRRGGDLDGYVAVEAEQNRFDAQRTVPDASDVSKTLSTAVSAYRKTVLDADREREKKTADLLRRYIIALNNLISQLMKQDKIAEAKDVKAEKDKVVFTLADIESKMLNVDTVPVHTAKASEQQNRLVGHIVTPKTNTLESSKVEAEEDDLSTAENVSPQLRKGLLLYWDFRKDEGDKATDRSGNKHTGKVSGATWSKDGKLGGAYEFNGNGTVASEGPVEQPDTGEISVSVWIRPSLDYNKDSGLRQITSHSWGTHQLRYIMGVLEVELYDVKHVVRQYNYPVTLKAGRWYHVVFTAKASRKMILYVDGHRVLEGDVDFNLEVATKEFRIGNCVGNDRGFFAGAIDEVMIWDRVLSDAEVNQLGRLCMRTGEPRNAAVADSRSTKAEGTQTLTIIKATYGIASAEVDVTEKVQGLVENDRLEIPAGTSCPVLFGIGDPAPYKTKTLKIEYSAGAAAKRTSKKSFDDGKKVVIP